MKPTVAQLQAFVGNPEAYAVQAPDGSWRPVRERLDSRVLMLHRTKQLTVGTYVGHHRGYDSDPMGRETVSHTLVFDIDNGSHDDTRAVQDALVTLGAPPICVGVEESGRKGFHVWLLLQEDAPNAELRRVGRAALALANLPASTEVFPKQDEVRDLGNLVKLPGGVHRVTGNENNFLGPIPRRMSPVAWAAVLEELPPEEVRARSGVTDTRFPCMEAVQEEGVEEGSRNTQLFHLATMLRRAGVSDANVDAAVRRANGIGDPLEDPEVDALLDSSRHSGPLCAQLPEDRHCGELCILEKTKGLYTRPRQLANAAVGENVVVTVKGRDGKVVTFSHDDVGIIKGVLRDE